MTVVLTGKIEGHPVDVRLDVPDRIDTTMAALLSLLTSQEARRNEIKLVLAM